MKPGHFWRTGDPVWPVHIDPATRSERWPVWSEWPDLEQNDPNDFVIREPDNQILTNARPLYQSGVICTPLSSLCVSMDMRLLPYAIRIVSNILASKISYSRVSVTHWEKHYSRSTVYNKKIIKTQNYLPGH